MPPKKSLPALLVLLALVGLSASACDFFEQRNRTYDDDPQLAFAQTRLDVETVDETPDSVDTQTVAAEIQLIGPQRDSDLPVSVSVADSSTAEAGEQYRLENTSATIPAGESSTEVTIEVLDNELDDGDTNYELFLNLQESEGIRVAPNLDTYTLVIRGTDEEDEDDG